MIRKFISRVLGRNGAGKHGQPAVIGVAQHGLQRDDISRGCQRTIETLQENGYQAYIVGGAVRDLLAGLTHGRRHQSPSRYRISGLQQPDLPESDRPLRVPRCGQCRNRDVVFGQS